MFILNSFRKNKSCFMVRCIIQPNNSADKEALLLPLEKIIKSRWPEATITLKTDKDYWKWQGYREFIYNVSNPDFIFVKEVMTLFDVKWEYLKNEADYKAFVYFYNKYIINCN